MPPENHARYISLREVLQHAQTRYRIERIMAVRRPQPEGYYNPYALYEKPDMWWAINEGLDRLNAANPFTHWRVVVPRRNHPCDFCLRRIPSGSAYFMDERHGTPTWCTSCLVGFLLAQNIDESPVRHATHWDREQQATVNLDEVRQRRDWALVGITPAAPASPVSPTPTTITIVVMKDPTPWHSIYVAYAPAFPRHKGFGRIPDEAVEALRQQLTAHLWSPSQQAPWSTRNTEILTTTLTAGEQIGTDRDDTYQTGKRIPYGKNMSIDLQVAPITVIGDENHVETERTKLPRRTNR